MRSKNNYSSNYISNCINKIISKFIGPLNVKDSEDINRNLLINDINLYLKDNYKNLVEYRVNGLLVLYNNMLQSLFSSQIKSLGFVIVARISSLC